jgi:[ribosomal protein S5]-alanine N-acetyltransferase
MLPIQLTSEILMREIAADDAKALAEAYTDNREHLAPWEPHRDDVFFTTRFQADLISAQREDLEAGRLLRCVIEDDSRIVGTANLSGIFLGSFRSANLGYWIDAEYVGRGLASQAVEALCNYAAGTLGLHRIQAGTLLHNAASQRVLTKCGFEAIGLAPEYLFIDGGWQDHRLYQRILGTDPA